MICIVYSPESEVPVVGRLFNNIIIARSASAINKVNINSGLEREYQGTRLRVKNSHKPAKISIPKTACRTERANKRKGSGSGFR